MKGEQTEGLALLDLLAVRIGCSCLSDLRYLADPERAMLGQAVERLAPGEFPLAEWNDALGYLFDRSPRQSPEDAQGLLLKLMGGKENQKKGNPGIG